MRKKIKIALPRLVIEILNEDISYFRISKEKLCNLIIQEFGFEPLSSLTERITNQVRAKGLLQFNLTEKNTKLFFKMLTFHNGDYESLVLRKIFSQYINLHPSLRESVVKKDLFIRLDTAIKNKHKLKIYHDENVVDIFPLEIEKDYESNYNNLKAQKEEELYLYSIRDIEILNVIS